MITPHNESYRANEDCTSPFSLGTRPPELAPRSKEGVSGEIARTHKLLFEPRQVVELRAIRGRETVSGYFDDREALAREACKLDGRGYAVYVTLNEVNPALLARAVNRARKVYKEPTTSDSDIVRRCWLPLDFDPVRPAGVSSTDEEKMAALPRAREVRDFLTGHGWPESVVGDSGNGVHLLYRVDLPNDQESLQLVKGVLESLAFKFSDKAVEVDTTICNAARIWKLYGTTAQKGEDTKERPHRRSGLLEVPKGGAAAEVVNREKLDAVAAMRPDVASRQERAFDPGRNGHKEEFDLAEWIDQHNVPVKREGPWERGGYRYVLGECPLNGHADNAAYIVEFANGAIAAGCHHNSCQGLVWRNFREHYEPDAYERNSTRDRAGCEDNGGDRVWAEPMTLPDGLPPVESFDPVLLPKPLSGWVSDVSERMQVPPDFCAAGAVVIAAALVGRTVGIRPKRQDDWTVVPNLWGAVVGNPAMLKSAALAEVMHSLDRLVAKARKVYQAAEAIYEIEATTAEAMKAGIKERIRKAARDDNEATVRNLVARLKETEAPDEPKPKRYKTEDPTTEKLAELLIDNPRGLLVYRDELSAWLRSLDKQGREADRAFYLESWNGTGSFEIDRIGRGSLLVPALCVSILGGIQPGPLRSYVYEAARGGEGADGLLQRFQLLVWPDPPRSWSNVDRWPDAAKERAFTVYERLDALSPKAAGATDDGEGSMPALRFVPEAQEIFDEWRGELETCLRGDELSPSLESHLAKYRSLMPSLALVFYLISVVNGAVEAAGGVNAEAVLRATAWCEYLETHARRLYASAEDTALEGARVLLGRIRKGDVRDGCTIREVYRGHEWSRLSTPEEVNAAAAVLEEHDWLRVEKVGTQGRPTCRIRLHPVLLGGKGKEQ